jgi:hypothetical protein
MLPIFGLQHRRGSVGKLFVYSPASWDILNSWQRLVLIWNQHFLTSDLKSQTQEATEGFGALLAGISPSSHPDEKQLFKWRISIVGNFSSCFFVHLYILKQKRCQLLN